MILRPLTWNGCANLLHRLSQQPGDQLQVVDVGTGTGIWCVAVLLLSDSR